LFSHFSSFQLGQLEKRCKRKLEAVTILHHGQLWKRCKRKQETVTSYIIDFRYGSGNIWIHFARCMNRSGEFLEPTISEKGRSSFAQASPTSAKHISLASAGRPARSVPAGTVLPLSTMFDALTSSKSLPQCTRQQCKRFTLYFLYLFVSLPRGHYSLSSNFLA